MTNPSEKHWMCPRSATHVVWCDRMLEGFKMDKPTLLIIIILVIVLAGGGWYGRGRWF